MAAPPNSSPFVLSVGAGLTLTGSVVSNDYATGKTSGQTLYGGTASGGTLTLRGSAHSTQGTVSVHSGAIFEPAGGVHIPNDGDFPPFVIQSELYVGEEEDPLSGPNLFLGYNVLNGLAGTRIDETKPMYRQAFYDYTEYDYVGWDISYTSIDGLVGRFPLSTYTDTLTHETTNYHAAKNHNFAPSAYNTPAARFNISFGSLTENICEIELHRGDVGGSGWTLGPAHTESADAQTQPTFRNSGTLRHTVIRAQPNGDWTGSQSFGAGLELFGTDLRADSANWTALQIHTRAVDHRIISYKGGTGTYLPIVIQMGDTDVATFTAAGDLELTGDITKIRNVATSFPAANAKGVLTNDAEGNLSWENTNVASWTAAVRYYAVDYDAGDDDNAGYSDVSMTAAGAVAVKTLERVAEIIPCLASGQTLCLAIKARAAGVVYRNDDDSADGILYLGLNGYAHVVIRATDSFANDGDDQMELGAVVAAAGPNLDDSWTVTTGATTSSFTIDAGTLPSEISISHKRIRWLTGALAGTTATIWKSSSTAIEPTQNLDSAPSNGDTFLIEEQGVLIGSLGVGNSGYYSGPTNIGELDIAGIATKSSFTIKGPTQVVNMAFCGQRNTTGLLFNIADVSGLNISNWYYDEDYNYYYVGGSRIDAGGLIKGGGKIDALEHFGATSNAVANMTFAISNTMLARVPNTGQGCNFWNGISLQQLNNLPPANSNGGAFGELVAPAFGNGGSVTVRPARFPASPNASGAAAIFLKETNMWLNGCIAENIGADAAVKIEGNGCIIQVDNFAGTTGNTGYGIDVSTARNCQVTIDDNGGAVTVAGSAGEVIIGGGALATYADLLLTNVIDNRGNLVQAGHGTVGIVTIISKAGVLVTNKSGSAVAVGDIVRSNGTSGEVVKALADTAAHAAGPLLVMITAAADNAVGYAVGIGDGAVIRFDAAPTAGTLCYLDEGTAGMATETVPPAAATNQKRRLGYPLVTGITGNRARLWGSCELLAVTSDGLT